MKRDATKAGPHREALTAFAATVGDRHVLSEQADIAPYLSDWTNEHTGDAFCVLRPSTTREVSKCIEICRTHSISVVPQGGRTGLVRGGMPMDGRLHAVLNLERLNRVRAIDPVSFTITAEAGVILDNARAAAAEHDLLLPLSLGAQGSCQIGGNIATNAGGLNVLRYGMTRDLVLGLEAVLPDGRILDGLNSLRKDNRGIDINQLLIGSEGTLGVITAATMKLVPLPEKTETLFIGLPSFEAAVELYSNGRRMASDLISAFEVMSAPTVDFARATVADTRFPLAGKHTAYVLAELSGSAAVNLRELAEVWIGQALETGLAGDAAIAESGAQAAAMWKFREDMVEAQTGRGLHFRSDVSVPISRIAELAERATANLSEALPECDVLVYGHIGDGNLHINVLGPANASRTTNVAMLAAAEPLLYKEVERLGGSISAEHGIGRAKKDAFLAQADPVKISLLRTIGWCLDPEGIMNPGCMFDKLGDEGGG
ncbi:FAD-binding oxidoreductase [Oricola sp.]|uniref:FAD-binding oxidoreductase n=1 Tax=Oricola sp. TaxID=1979950 RepID=UPI003BAC4BE6